MADKNSKTSKKSHRGEYTMADLKRNKMCKLKKRLRKFPQDTEAAKIGRAHV